VSSNAQLKIKTLKESAKSPRRKKRERLFKIRLIKMRCFRPRNEMNNGKYDNQNIKDYLLGSLPEAETEYFDELSFTDDDFADALKAAENDLIDAYIHKELAGETLEKFESHYLASPLRREKVDFAGNLQIFAARAVAENNVESKPEKNSDGLFFALKNLITGNRALPLGFAGALIVLILAGLWFINNRRVPTENETAVQNTPASAVNERETKQIEERKSVNSESNKEIAAIVNQNNAAPPQNSNKENVSGNGAAAINRNAQTPKPPPGISIASFVLAPPLRSSGSQIPSFSISQETVSVAVRLQLEADDYPAYRVALSDESGGKNLWLSGRLRAQGKGENKSLNVQFPAKLLKPQIYSLVVSGVKDGEAEILTNYTFRAVLK
jgi:hypothetical protein